MHLEINAGYQVSLEIGQLYLLGKQLDGVKTKSNNYIELDNGEDISERHCVIETNENQEAFAFDLFSLKGTLLNNQILSSMKKTLLKNGDILKIGDKEIKYIQQGHEMSCDSSGFLEVHKSPESSQSLNDLKRLDDHNLMPMRPSTSFSSHRSDSFAIPETQHCKPRNSLNDSSLSIAESTPNKSDQKIKFNFGNQDSFGDDDLCIPETQELAPLAGSNSSQSSRLHSDKLTSISNEESENVKDGSQFRICTQDYNEGFGEEESVDNLHSQIIPIIKHAPVVLDKTFEHPNTSSVSQSLSDQINKEMSALKWRKSNANQENTELRSDCVTPDLFEFETVANKAVNENPNILEEDEEDFLPTQRLPAVFKKAEEEKVLNQTEEPCLEKDPEEVLTLSDKENRCPATLEPITDMSATQILGARSHASISHSNSISSAVKANISKENKNTSQALLNVDSDEEDDLLTQAFLRPKSASVKSSSSSSKNMATRCFNSTLLDDKCTEKPPATYFAEVEKTPVKQMPISSANVFKKPERDLGILKKASSASSTASENDIELLMCTPQLITDNWSLGKTEDLRKHILAVKNRHLFGDETEDEEDEQNNLVKLINVPKSSLDFDHLLPHLNQRPECSKEEHNELKEAHKIYKFNISFGKEQEEKQTNLSKSKTSTYSRDERHAARDKGKEISEQKLKTRTSTAKRQDKMEKEVVNKGRKSVKEVENKNREGKKKESDQEERDCNLEDSKRKTDLKSKQAKNSDTKSKQVQRNNQEETSSGPETTARLRKRQVSDKYENQESESVNKEQLTPARRLMRSRSRLQETSSSSSTKCNVDGMDTIPTQQTVRATRSRSKSEQNISQDSSTTSDTSTKLNKSRRKKIEPNESPNLNTATKKTKRKRKAEASTAVIPAKIERKRLRSTESPAPPLSNITVSVTNVDQLLIKDLLKNAKGLWSIATNAADCDILVMDKPLRTFKFLLAMAKGVPIVTSEYLKKLNECRTLKEANLKDYKFSDTEFEKKYKFSMLKSLQVAKKQKIFKDYEFLMTASIVPIPQEIKAIIEASGGYVHGKTPPQPKENQNLYLVTAKEDKKDWHKYRRLNKNIIIISTEAIMSAIMSQSSERMKGFTLA